MQKNNMIISNISVICRDRTITSTGQNIQPYTFALLAKQKYCCMLGEVNEWQPIASILVHTGMQNAIESRVRLNTNLNHRLGSLSPLWSLTPWCVCKVSDWRSGNDTRVRRMLRDMVNQETLKVVICVEEMHKLQLWYISNQNKQQRHISVTSVSGLLS